MLPPDVATGRLRGPLGDARGAIARAAEAARAHGSEVQLVRPGAIAGEAHLASAALHARRAHAEGRARAQTQALEFLRYLSGERQITRAIAAVGLQDGSSGAIAVTLGGDAPAALVAVARALGAALEPGSESRDERRDPFSEQAALERTALVDLER